MAVDGIGKRPTFVLNSFRSPNDHVGIQQTRSTRNTSDIGSPHQVRCLQTIYIHIFIRQHQYNRVLKRVTKLIIIAGTPGPINESAVDFLLELGHSISSKFQEERQSAYLFQRLSVTVQRYNAVIFHDSFPPGSDLWPPME